MPKEVVDEKNSGSTKRPVGKTHEEDEDLIFYEGDEGELGKELKGEFGDEELEPEGKKWFYTGEEGRREKKRAEAQAQMRAERSVKRFRLSSQEEALIVFVDNPTFYIYEHFNLKIQDKYGNYVTCTKEFGGCPVCNEGNNSSLVAYGTVIDCRKFTRKDGTVSKWRKVLFPIKGDNLNRFESIIDEHGDLAGKVFKAKRFGERDFIVGSQFVYKGKLDISTKFGKEAAAPIDYVRVLAPLSKEELLSLGFKSPFVYGSEEDIGEGNDQEDLSDLGDLDVF